MLRSSFAAPTSATIDELDSSVLQSEMGHSAHHTSLSSIALIVLSTVSSAAAQILLGMGADSLGEAGLMGILTNFALIGGYACLAMNLVLVGVALRGGQLSVLYPIMALSYVWVTILSPMFFDDIITSSQVVGLVLIVAGVGFIGAGSRS